MCKGRVFAQMNDNWHPGSSYYIWLRWLASQGGRCSSPSPKPETHLVRYRLEGPGEQPIKTWRVPGDSGTGSGTSAEDRRRLSLRTRLGLRLLRPYAIDQAIAAREKLNAEPGRDSHQLKTSDGSPALKGREEERHQGSLGGHLQRRAAWQFEVKRNRHPVPGSLHRKDNGQDRRPGELPPGGHLAYLQRCG
jgi:hypothetical protein